MRDALISSRVSSFRSRCVAATALVVIVATAHAQAGTVADGWAAAGRGAQYLLTRQTDNGSFFSTTAAADQVAEAIEAIVAGGIEGAPVAKALAYVSANGPARAAQRAAYAGRIVMGIVAGGANPRSFGGVDYVAMLKAFKSANGTYESSVYANALAVLGLVAAHEVVPADAVVAMRAQQCSNGGFGFQSACAGGADLDTTSVNVMALIGAGESPASTTLAAARSFLIDARNSQGGFGYAADQPTNGNSTGLALSAIAAFGEDPTAPPWSGPEGDPLSALLALEVSGGGFKYLASNSAVNDYTTVQAVPGAAGAAYPIRPRPPVAPPVVSAPSEGESVASRDVLVWGSAGAGDTVEIAENGSVLGSTRVGPDGSWSRTLSLADGRHALAVVATDEAGRRSTIVERSFFVDLFPPPTVEQPTNGSVLDTPVVTFGGRVTPGATVVVAEGTTELARGVGGTDRRWSASASMPDGVHTVVARAILADGTVSRDVMSRFTIDTSVVPAPRITTPAEGARTAGRFDLAGTGPMGATVAIFEHDELLRYGQISSTGQWGVLIGLPNGAHVLTARAIDDGRTSDPSDPVSVVVDAIDPTVEITTQNAAITSTIGGTAVDQGGIESVRVDFYDLKGVRVATVEDACQCAGSADAAWTVEVPFAPGYLEARAFAIDVAGNRSRLVTRWIVAAVA